MRFSENVSSLEAYGHLSHSILTLNLLTTTIVSPPSTLRTGDKNSRFYNCARRVTQICVFNTCLISTHYTLNYALHGICYKFLKKHSMKVDLRGLKPRECAIKQLKSPVLNVLSFLLLFQWLQL